MDPPFAHLVSFTSTTDSSLVAASAWAFACFSLSICPVWQSRVSQPWLGHLFPPFLRSTLATGETLSQFQMTFDSSSIAAIRTGWKVLVRFYGMLLLSTKHPTLPEWTGKHRMKDDFENHRRPQIPFGSPIEYHPFLKKIKFFNSARKYYQESFLVSRWSRGNFGKRDILVADIENLEKFYASDINRRRMNANEVLIKQKDDEFIISSCRWYSKSVRKRLRIPGIHTEAGTDRKETRFQQRTSWWTGKVSTDRNHRWRWSPCRFLVDPRGLICRHHIEPRFQLYVPKEETFRKSIVIYIDVTRSTYFDLDVLQEKRLGRHFVKFLERIHKILSLLKEKPPKGHTCSRRRLTKIQTTTRSENLWPEVWTKMGKAAQNRKETGMDKRKLLIHDDEEVRRNSQEWRPEPYWKERPWHGPSQKRSVLTVKLALLARAPGKHCVNQVTAKSLNETVHSMFTWSNSQTIDSDDEEMRRNSHECGDENWKDPRQQSSCSPKSHPRATLQANLCSFRVISISRTVFHRRIHQTMFS